jgi:hypothetical protein
VGKVINEGWCNPDGSVVPLVGITWQIRHHPPTMSAVGR